MTSNNGTIYARDWAQPDSSAQTHLKTTWLANLNKSKDKNRRDQPNYYVNDPQSLITSARVHRFAIGTGDDIYSSVIPIIEAAESEVILITCFWEKSSSLERVCKALKSLSSKATARGADKIKVYIGFSSSSLFQKLFHTASLHGKTYDSQEWQRKLGLPPGEELPGLQLRVKSLFFLPFSVMHPKFIIVDRQIVILPSCNVSWVPWFEGSIVLSGRVAQQFVRLWSEFWDRGGATALVNRSTRLLEAMPPPESAVGPSFSTFKFGSEDEIPAIFLPSPHHRNPRFQPFVRSANVVVPPTPLNTFVLTLLRTATSSIYMQTPNLTSPPVLAAILESLRCGVDVHVVTCDDLMVLEQLGTAATTTARCVRALRKQYRALPGSRRGRASARIDDEEVGFRRPGALRIDYFRPRRGGARENDPVKSHLKLTIVDGEWVVLGSGNMDRASWFTSQELGVALWNADLAKEIRDVVGRNLEGRLERVEG